MPKSNQCFICFIFFICAVGIGRFEITLSLFLKVNLGAHPFIIITQNVTVTVTVTV